MMKAPDIIQAIPEVQRTFFIFSSTYRRAEHVEQREYTELSEWYDERQVYEWLRRDSVARATYPLLNAFYANQESLLTDEIRTLDANMDFLCRKTPIQLMFQNQSKVISG